MTREVERWEVDAGEGTLHFVLTDRGSLFLGHMALDTIAMLLGTFGLGFLAVSLTMLATGVAGKERAFAFTLLAFGSVMQQCASRLFHWNDHRRDRRKAAVRDELRERGIIE